jgi:hypothetical protein
MVDERRLAGDRLRLAMDADRTISDERRAKFEASQARSSTAWPARFRCS